MQFVNLIGRFDLVNSRNKFRGKKNLIKSYYMGEESIPVNIDKMDICDTNGINTMVNGK